MISRRDVLRLGAAGITSPILGMIVPTTVSILAQDNDDTGAAVVTWRGNPGRTGEMPGPAPSMDQPINIKWMFRHDGYETGALVVQNETLFFGSNDNHVYALDTRTGSLRWQFNTRGSAAFSPAVDEDTIYIPSDDGNLYAIETASGEEKWRFAFPSGETTAPMSGPGANSAPVVHRDTVFLKLRDGYFYAIRADTGEERFHVNTGSYGSLSQYFATGSDVAVFTQDALSDPNTSEWVAIDLNTGLEMWRSDLPLQSHPIIRDETIYFPSINGVFALNLESGEPLWRNEFLSNQTVATETALYCWGDESEIVAFSTDSGEALWTLRDELMNGSRGGSLAVVESILYLVSNRALFALDRISGQQLWKVPFTMSLDPMSTPPAAINNTVFIPNNSNDDGRIFAVGNPEPTLIIGEATIRETPSNNARETGTVDNGDQLSWVGPIEEHRGQKWIEIRLNQFEGWILLDAVDQSTLPDPDAFDFRLWVDPEA